jgi:hypothetical protein
MKLVGDIMTARPFNEGKALDAVIRHLEARECSARSDLRFPELDGRGAPVELVCMLGPQLFAFEHTGVEAFHGQLQMDADAEKLLVPLMRRLTAAINTNDHLMLDVPVDATVGLKSSDVPLVRDSIERWALATAPTLQATHRGSRETPTKGKPQGVPFEVSLHRFETTDGPTKGQVSFRRIVAFDVEKARAPRLQQAYDDKLGKLSAWKSDFGARTVLILEESDIALTNHHLVAAAALAVERSTTNRPDEVYLLSTATKGGWSLMCIRCDTRTHYDVDDPVQNIWEVDPDTLKSLTNR